MWFIGQFENGSWGFQQNEDCPPRYTSKHEAECIQGMYEALKLYQKHQEGTSGHFCGECAKAINLAVEKAEEE